MLRSKIKIKLKIIAIEKKILMTNTSNAFFIKRALFNFYINTALNKCIN